MSPEHCSGASRVDHRGDVYSLGCMLFEMIVGAPPFTSSRVQEVLASHKFRRPPSLAALTVDTPPWLDRLVTRMLSKEPDERPQAMAEVAGRWPSRRGAAFKEAEDAAAPICRLVQLSCKAPFRH